MLVAAKTLALTAHDLFTDPGAIQKARAEFDLKRGANFVYPPLIGDRPLNYRGSWIPDRRCGV